MSDKVYTKEQIAELQRTFALEMEEMSQRYGFHAQVGGVIFSQDDNTGQAVAYMGGCQIGVCQVLARMLNALPPPMLVETLKTVQARQGEPVRYVHTPTVKVGNA